MLMSHAAISPGVTGWPNCGASAHHAAVLANSAAANNTAPAMMGSSQRIVHLALRIDAPACDGVVVILPAQAALGGELRARRLHHAGVVVGAKEPKAAKAPKADSRCSRANTVSVMFRASSRRAVSAADQDA